MNIAKKIYCRVFQTVFKLAIPILPYRNPLVLSKREEIGDVLLEKKLNSVLIVTDKVIHSLGLLDPLKKSLEEKNIRYFVYDKTVPNPTIANVEEAVSIYKENKLNALVGFGGGSSIDCAKAIGARIAKPRQPISKMEGILRVHRKIPFLIAVPTTAGTGSETTVTTVITDEITRHKFTASDFPLIPRVAVLDAEVTKNLPPHIVATTGMDALTHAIEAYIGRSTTKSTRNDALTAMKLISENLEKAYNGGDSKNRENMLKASFLAGRAFSKSYVGYCHAVAHTLGGKYNIAHGLANAVLLPYVLEAYDESIYKKSKDIVLAMGIADENIKEKDAHILLVKKIREMNENMGIPTKLSGIKREDIKELSGYAEKEANPLYPVPKLMTREELEQFYFDVMED